ncbi:MAG: hypothetical protein EA001_15870 [Oscillatoriales cyanobacterium]|nr:MAG: hypothetical protein EA001_15870 [Oscillatoriales cyanobacterium]
MAVFSRIKRYVVAGGLPSLGVAIAYGGIGLLSGYLALPPGYASPVWPAAGLALLGVLCWGRKAYPGIWFGSCCLNMAIGLKASGELTPVNVLVAVTIALGAVTQAAFGNWLLAKLFKRPIWLAEVPGILAFLILAGPASCLVGATIGNSALLISGSLSPAGFIESWWNWWIGDSLGVVAILPIGTIYLLKQRRIPLILQKETAQERHFLSYILPVLLALVSTILIFEESQNREQQRIEAVFQSDVHIITQRLQDNLDHATHVLFGLKSLFDSGSFPAGAIGVNREQFQKFAQPYLESVQGIQSVSWTPLVTRSTRQQYEQLARQEGFPNFQFQKQNAQKLLVPDDDRDLYYPVFYIEPLAKNFKALGFNLGSESRRLKTLIEAQNSGRMTATPPIELAQGTAAQKGVILYLPLYATPKPSTLAERQQSLQGYVATVFRVGDLFKESFSNLIPEGMTFVLEDSQTQEQLDQSITTANPGQVMTQAETTIDFGDRVWIVRFSGGDRYFQPLRTQESAFVLWAGFLITGLIGGFSISQARNSVVVNLLVQQRTYELFQSRKLALESAQLAEKANQAKSNFLTIMSHELRTPLNAVLGFTECLREGILGPVNLEQIKALKSIEASGDHLLELITDILDFVKLEEGKVDLDFQPVSANVLCQSSAGFVRHQALNKYIDLEVYVPPTLPAVVVDKRRMRQVLINLLINAVKFTPESGHVVLAVEQLDRPDPWLRFSVTDTGIGIAEADFDRIFQPFSQVESSLNRRYEGTGLGLALVKRIVELHGGRVSLTSSINEGSCFTVDLPCFHESGLTSATFAVNSPSLDPAAIARMDRLN